MSKTNTLTALALILPLAACGGSGSDLVQDIAEALADGSIDPSIIPALADAGAGDLSVDEIEEAAGEFEEEFGEIVDEADYTDLMSLPSSGSATFAGIVGAGPGQVVNTPAGIFVEAVENADVEIVGEMTLTLALGDDELTGDVVNLQYVDDGEALSGTLDVSADLDRAVDLDEEFGIFGSITGDLTDSDGDFSVDITIVADLFGENAEALAGEGGGFISFDDQPDTPAAVVFGLVNQGALN